MIYVLLHRSDLNISVKLCHLFRIFRKILPKNAAIFQHFSSNFAQILMKISRNFAEDKRGNEYPCIEREVVHSVMKAKLQHSFDGHRARDTSIFLHIFPLQHFNFLLLSDPMFPFSIFISLFSNRSSSRNAIEPVAASYSIITAAIRGH